MIDGGKLLAQCIRIVVGLVLAFVAAAAFVAFGLLRGLQDPAGDPVVIGLSFGWSLVGASLIGGLAFAPALAAVVLAEALRLRGVVFHLAAGGAIATVLWWSGEGPAHLQADVRPGTIVAAATGFLAGFVYWVVAGRQSGCWRISARDVRED
ncbi:translation initiation factor IF-3 [Stappia sp. TSB10GB4]|uniref:translation initiation factor IF-3 n=1 Tax=Stappia sp. TSB10GB4 TaxID=2003584 RepID=UPI001644D9D4|nr:translation initiation factor IF-3 [Stappia sp. TSB10GB4]